jgi:hypothetical protein
VQLAGDPGALAGAGELPFGGHGGVEPLGHTIDVVFQLGDLVAAGHGHAMVVVAVGDGDGGGGQPPQPAGEPPGRQQTEDEPDGYGRGQYQQSDPKLRPERPRPRRRPGQVGRDRHLHVHDAEQVGREEGLGGLAQHLLGVLGVGGRGEQASHGGGLFGVGAHVDSAGVAVVAESPACRREADQGRAVQLGASGKGSKIPTTVNQWPPSHTRVGWSSAAIPRVLAAW